jgi:hypothetical protein
MWRAEAGSETAGGCVLRSTPITTSPDDAEAQIAASLGAGTRNGRAKAQIILTYPNGDWGPIRLFRLNNFTDGRRNTVLRQKPGRRLYH